MRPDLLRLGQVVVLAVLIGFLLNQVFLCLSLALIAFLFWKYKAVRKVHHFVRNAAADKDLPDIPGVINEIIRDIDSLRSYHRQREDKLSGFLSRFQEATEALPDAVIVMDAYGHIEWSNKRAYEYLGIKCPRDSGQRFSNLIRHPDLVDYLADITNFEAQDSLVIASPLQGAIKLEIRVTKYGESSMLLVARDVTEIQRINHMRKDFIANASHELRTPLTVISGYLEAFESDDEDCPPQWLPQIKQMRIQAKRMQNLIEDLLKLSRLEGSNASADDEVNVMEIISLIHNEAQTLSGILNHIFYLETDPDISLLGDQGNLYSAFSNIVFNAVQYTPESGVIRIKWYLQDDTKVVFEVTDSGEGIAPEHINRITERFYRVDKGRSREKGGTGLGLAIVKHVMVQHDAELNISSELGKGTTIKCIFPSKRFVVNSKPASASASA